MRQGAFGLDIIPVYFSSLILIQRGARSYAWALFLDFGLAVTTIEPISIQLEVILLCWFVYCPKFVSFYYVMSLFGGGYLVCPDLDKGSLEVKRVMDWSVCFFGFISLLVIWKYLFLSL